MITREEPTPVAVSNVVSPQRTTADETVLNSRLRVFNVSASSSLKFVFQNSEGVAYNLSGGGFTFEAVIRELVTGSSPIQLTVTISNASKGVLSIAVPSSVPAGAYRGSVGMVSSGTVILTNNFRLFVSKDNVGEAPSIQEIRLLIRDTAPEESLLLEGNAFSDEEILTAMEYALRYWNETPPDLGVIVSTQGFPYKHHLVEGILGRLFMIAAEEYRKNALQYSAGGLTVADKDKEGNYQKAAQFHWQNWQQFVDLKKSEINASRGWGVIYSPYSYI